MPPIGHVWQVGIPQSTFLAFWLAWKCFLNFVCSSALLHWQSLRICESFIGWSLLIHHWPHTSLSVSHQRCGLVTLHSLFWHLVVFLECLHYCATSHYSELGATHSSFVQIVLYIKENKITFSLLNKGVILALSWRIFYHTQLWCGHEAHVLLISVSYFRIPHYCLCSVSY